MLKPDEIVKMQSALYTSSVQCGKLVTAVCDSLQRLQAQWLLVQGLHERLESLLMGIECYAHKRNIKPTLPQILGAGPSREAIAAFLGAKRKYDAMALQTKAIQESLTTALAGLQGLAAQFGVGLTAAELCRSLKPSARVTLAIGKAQLGLVNKLIVEYAPLGA